VLLFIGDDWAEGHHDVVVQDEAGKTLARRRLPEGADGFARFHEVVASCWGEDSEPDAAQVMVVIESDRGPWVKALAAAGYRVYPVNPKQASRHKETIAVSGKKDDFFDAGCLADMGRTRRHQLRELAADSDIAEAVKIAARAHQKLVWERTRHLLRMRSSLREYFPAALEAYADLTLTGADALELLGRAPDPAAAARLTVTQITAALKRARRRGDLAQRARDIQAPLRTPHLAQPPVIAEAYAVSVRAGAAVITALNEQIKIMEAKVSELFHRHPDAGIYLSQPGIGDITGARVLGEFRGRARPVCHGQGPQELRRHLPADHPVRQEEDRARPVDPQPAPHRCPAYPGVRRDIRLSRCPRLLRRAPQPRHRARGRAAPRRRPPHRHPARMRENRQRIRRSHRLVPPQHPRAGRINPRQPSRPRAFRHRSQPDGRVSTPAHRQALKVPIAPT
jgi:hypothetical protein